MPVLVSLVLGLVAVALCFSPSLPEETGTLEPATGGWLGTVTAALITLGAIAVVLRLTY